MFDWTPVLAFLAELRRHLRLFAVIALVFIVIAAVRYVTTPRAYLAVAVVGPPDVTTQSTTTSGGGGNPSGLARSLFGGGSAVNNDRYQKFLQLMHSTRLAQALIDNYHLDQILFGTPRQGLHAKGFIGRARDDLKNLFGIPIRETSRVDAVAAFLDDALTVESANSKASSLLTGTSSIYSRVSFRYRDPRQAEAVLNMILQQADDLIRGDIRHDVTNRLNYLQSELPRVTVSDQRDATIATLSAQRQIQMMIMADKHFAADQIDPPHASDTPTYPKGPRTYLIIALILSLIVWSGLVFAAMRIRKAAIVMAWMESAVYFRRIAPYARPDTP